MGTFCVYFNASDLEAILARHNDAPLQARLIGAELLAKVPWAIVYSDSVEGQKAAQVPGFFDTAAAELGRFVEVTWTDAVESAEDQERLDELRNDAVLELDVYGSFDRISADFLGNTAVIALPALCHQYRLVHFVTNVTREERVLLGVLLDVNCAESNGRGTAVFLPAPPPDGASLRLQGSIRILQKNLTAQAETLGAFDHPPPNMNAALVTYGGVRILALSDGDPVAWIRSRILAPSQLVGVYIENRGDGDGSCPADVEWREAAHRADHPTDPGLCAAWLTLLDAEPTSLVAIDRRYLSDLRERSAGFPGWWFKGTQAWSVGAPIIEEGDTSDYRPEPSPFLLPERS